MASDRDRPPPADRLRALLDAARRGDRTIIVGILNVTPDSFSDGGRFTTPGAAADAAERMLGEGADIVDIGGESTRPGAPAVPADEELRRVMPAVEAIVNRTAVPLSIDTRKSVVAARALEAGAVMVNDVTGMTHDPAMLAVAAQHGAAVCLMHMRGDPATMQARTDYGDVVIEVRDWLARQAERARRGGVAPESIVVDPGFGFAKTPSQNLDLLRRLRELTMLGYPVMVGTSRKSTIGLILGGLPPDERLEGTAATVALAIAHGAALVRVHDVREMVRVARVADAVVRANWPPAQENG